MTTWRHYASKMLPLVAAELRLPAAYPRGGRKLVQCPKHKRQIGRSNMCLDCHNEAYAEIGRRYALRSQGERTAP